MTTQIVYPSVSYIGGGAFDLSTIQSRSYFYGKQNGPAGPSPIVQSTFYRISNVFTNVTKTSDFTPDSTYLALQYTGTATRFFNLALTMDCNDTSGTGELSITAEWVKNGTFDGSQAKTAGTVLQTPFSTISTLIDNGKSCIATNAIISLSQNDVLTLIVANTSSTTVIQYSNIGVTLVAVD